MNIAGHKINNWWLIGGGAGLVLVIYLYRKGSSSSGSSTAANSSSAIDPLTGLPYSEDNQVDPLTGMTYLAEAQEYGSVSAAEAAVSSGSAYGSSGGGSAYSGTAGYPTLNAYGNTTVNGTSYATNAAWAQAVTTGLVSLGYSAADVSAALGLFFAGQPLGIAPDGVSYATIVQAAEAEFGLPPQGTYQIIAAPTGSTTASGTGGGTTTGTGTGTGTTGTGTGTGTTGTGTGGGTYTGTPAPPVTPPAKWQYPAPQNLSASGAGAGKIRVSWAPVVGPQGQIPSNYTVAYGRTSGAHTWENLVSGTSTTLTTQNGMTEYIEVWANGGPVAPPHAGPVKATAGS